MAAFTRSVDAARSGDIVAARKDGDFARPELVSAKKLAQR
jgi:SOS-response transcriptional repressor LexA